MPPVDGPWNARGMRLVTVDGLVRSMISDDGEVLDGNNVTLAYIEGNGEVGDPDMNYGGKAADNSGHVTDHNDNIIGSFDSGRGYIKDAQGSVVAELSKEGSITNNAGRGIGTIEGFEFVKIGTLAAYFLIVDRAFCRA